MLLAISNNHFNKIIIVAIIIFHSLSFADIEKTEFSNISFNKAVSLLNNHNALIALKYKTKSIKEEEIAESQWEDPLLRLDGSNFPINNFNMGNSAMTGIQLTLSQKIPITSKYSKLKLSLGEKAKAVHNIKNTLKRKLILKVWENAILKEEILNNITIYEENIVWVNDMIQASNQLYVVGKISQHVLFNLKIKSSELEALLLTSKQKIIILNSKLSEILNINLISLDINTMPWIYIENYSLSTANNNSQEISLESELKSAQYLCNSKRLEQIPDITIGFNYRYRDNFDSNGDFAGAFISIPIPFNKKRSSSYKSAVNLYKEKTNQLQSFRKNLKAKLVRLQAEINRYETELTIIKEKTIEFAKNSLEIIEKRYKVGTSSYMELINSVLKLQNLRLKVFNLESKIKNLKIQYLYETGSSLII